MPTLPPTWSPLPATEALARYEIWDSYLTQARGAATVPAIEALLPLVERVALKKLCYFPDVGLGTGGTAIEQWATAHPEQIDEPLRRWPELMLGMIQVNAREPKRSLEALDRWLRDGPMVGVYFPGGAPAGLPCTHPDVARLVERIATLGGAIMMHTWFKTNEPGPPHGSTPSDLAELAARFPEQTFICAHAGGNWELGLRAIRDRPNVVVETSGFDATAGFLEMAVREVGAERVVFGSHLPSRSLGTELGKILFAGLSEEQKRQVLGGNYRRLLRRG